MLRSERAARGEPTGSGADHDEPPSAGKPDEARAEDALALLSALEHDPPPDGISARLDALWSDLSTPDGQEAMDGGVAYLTAEIERLELEVAQLARTAAHLLQENDALKTTAAQRQVALEACQLTLRRHDDAASDRNEGHAGELPTASAAPRRWWGWWRRPASTSQ
ncbi:MAG: hypothetical protein AAGF45_08780 [Pseudomonadota bacterium]